MLRPSADLACEGWRQGSFHLANCASDRGCERVGAFAAARLRRGRSSGAGVITAGPCSSGAAGSREEALVVIAAQQMLPQQRRVDMRARAHAGGLHCVLQQHGDPVQQQRLPELLWQPRSLTSDMLQQRWQRLDLKR